MDRRAVDTSRSAHLLLICFIVHSAKRLVAGLRTDAPAGFSPVPHGHRRPEPGELVDYRCCSEVVSKRTIYLFYLNYLNYLNYLYLLFFCCSVFVVTLHAIRKFHKNHLITHPFRNLFSKKRLLLFSNCQTNDTPMLIGEFPEFSRCFVCFSFSNSL